MEQVFGRALLDYYKNREADTLFLHNNYGSTEEMPVDLFFRESDDFPELEHIALALCDGKILDVGAGAGSHALYLQENGKDVTALEKCAAACTIMTERGLKQVVNSDFFHYNSEKYDTLLFMMNGIGIAGTLERVVDLFNHAQTLLKPGGQLLFDSSDIAYLYADGKIPKPEGYYGEVGFQYEYKGIKGSPFPWVYVDQDTLIALGQAHGWVVQILFEDGQDQFLVRMELKKSTQSQYKEQALEES